MTDLKESTMHSFSVARCLHCRAVVAAWEDGKLTRKAHLPCCAAAAEEMAKPRTLDELGLV